MLKDAFYSIDKQIDNELESVFSIQINANHPIFEGHFPENPITPGVVQMEIVKELVSIKINKQVKLDTMSNCKFLAILNPIENSKIDVSLTLTETEESKVKVNAIFKNETITFLKMSAVFKKL